MTTETPTSTPRWAVAVGVVLLVDGAIGVIGYFIAFLFAYGFSEGVSNAQHGVFLTAVAVIGIGSAAVTTPVVVGVAGLGTRRAAAVAGWTTAAGTLIALGLGSIVSATHKDQNSVSASFSTTTDVVVATCLLVPGLVAAWLTWRTRPNGHPTTTRAAGAL